MPSAAAKGTKELMYSFKQIFTCLAVVNGGVFYGPVGA